MRTGASKPKRRRSPIRSKALPSWSWTSASTASTPQRRAATRASPGERAARLRYPACSTRAVRILSWTGSSSHTSTFFGVSMVILAFISEWGNARAMPAQNLQNSSNFEVFGPWINSIMFGPTKLGGRGETRRPPTSGGPGEERLGEDAGVAGVEGDARGALGLAEAGGD